MAVLVQVNETWSPVARLTVSRGRGGQGSTVRQAENSDVLFAGSVAVAVITLPTDTGTGRMAVNPFEQLPSVVTILSPRYVCPSPFPVGSQEGLAKNWIRKTVFALLLSVPSTAVLAPP